METHSDVKPCHKGAQEDTSFQRIFFVSVAPRLRFIRNFGLQKQFLYFLITF